MSGDILYGRQPVHEATRGRRAVHEILVELAGEPDVGIGVLERGP